MEGIIISMFDSDTFVINKLQENGTCPINEDELKQLSKNFYDLKPWDASLKRERKVLIKIKDIPLHLFCHDNIRQIGARWGELLELSYIPVSFHYVAMLLSMDSSKQVEHSIIIKAENEEFNMNIRELCKCEFETKYENHDDDMNSFNDSRSPVHSHLNEQKSNIEDSDGE